MIAKHDISNVNSFSPSPSTLPCIEENKFIKKCERILRNHIVKQEQKIYSLRIANENQERENKKLVHNIANKERQNQELTRINLSANRIDKEACYETINDLEQTNNQLEETLNVL